ncbi:hypothetical protein CONLIGDRAFT_215731 [Coniochaeta ligniaria NRRL 30616]|uniref:Zn(2)-C6 fungal-type domain-containing protein n=1 Tax=Coniochaeta ligniaria NRRL 30616 TaxID=1408157 RepID=A0A1J7I548_9PEZI|nr:hypothetical protein CONLIGDRAFT_215731 [Coniochaeta ligniaria NRRL 30616]
MGRENVLEVQTSTSRSTMVYHGVVSKGCERCRQRKVKCDQRKPQCLRCEKAKTQCPGYRNLADVLFRDESERIERRARILNGDLPVPQNRPSSDPSSKPPSPPTSVPRPLGQPVTELAANFFFTKYYVCDEPSLPDGAHKWLAQAYSETPPNHALRAVIEAAGMAGISNVHHAPSMRSRSKHQYGLALEALKTLLNDVNEAVADTTLMTVNLFGLFEFITFDNWDHSQAWAAHIAGATALLQLRGQEQFKTERGGLLFVQLRSQMLYACMQHDVPLSPALLQLSHMFDISILGQRRKESRPGPLGYMCFRLLHLRDAIRRDGLRDKQTICATLAEIDRDLMAWAACHPTCMTLDAPVGSSDEIYFQGKRHVYSNLLTAQAWNNWRTLRIVANQMMIQTEACSDLSDITGASSSASPIIRQLSDDICISAASFAGSPRIVGIIWPLSVVARESSNTLTNRRWAVEQLRSINLSMGFRQAGLLAETISRELDTSAAPC